MTSRHLLWRIAIVTLLAYSAWHFVYSGVMEPLSKANLRDIGREVAPLQAYVDGDASAWSPTHNRQYGPLFMFIIMPFLLIWDHQQMWLANALYVLQLVTFGAAFAFTWLTLRLYLDERGRLAQPRRLSTLAFTFVLIVLWLNFSPAYYLLATKNVETWELCLLSIGLYASVRWSGVLGGACIGAATMIKLLPVAFIPMFVLRNRRAAISAIVSIIVVLGAAQLVFGPAAGFRYVSQVVAAAAAPSGYGNTAYSLTIHENNSLKGAVAKAFGSLNSPYAPPPPFPRGYYVSMSPEAARYSNVIGTLLQLAGAAIFMILIWRSRAVTTAPVRTEIWCWALTAAFMMILPPQSAFHYMILTLPAVSFAVICAIEEWSEGWYLRGAVLFAVVLLVANIAPRLVINRVLGMDLLRQWSGYTHLTGSETYQYFCLPLVGMLLLIVFLWSVRPAAPRIANAA